MALRNVKGIVINPVANIYIVLHSAPVERQKVPHLTRSVQALSML